MPFSEHISVPSITVSSGQPARANRHVAYTHLRDYDGKGGLGLQPGSESDPSGQGRTFRGTDF